MTTVIAGVVDATIVTALGLLVCAALRRRPAALRHMILVASLAAAAIAPVLEIMLPNWELPVLSSSAQITDSGPALSSVAGSAGAAADTENPAGTSTHLDCGVRGDLGDRFHGRDGRPACRPRQTGRSDAALPAGCVGRLARTRGRVVEAACVDARCCGVRESRPRASLDLGPVAAANHCAGRCPVMGSGTHRRRPCARNRARRPSRLGVADCRGNGACCLLVQPADLDRLPSPARRE